MVVNHEFLAEMARQRVAKGFRRSAAFIALEAIKHAQTANDAEGLARAEKEFGKLISEFETPPLSSPPSFTL